MMMLSIIIGWVGTFKKFASMLLAMALASSVLPVPGGPYNRTPFGGLIPTRINNSGFVRGSSITYLIIYI
jgi:hypothetical protein